ncbi:MAG TPA: hypothetical protein VGE18_01330 [Candidatus Paceibacterota bacterium]
MPRLPQVGGDENNWGELLNEFLEVAHNEDGTINIAAVEGLSAALAAKANLVSGKVPIGEIPTLSFTHFTGSGTVGDPYVFDTETYLTSLPGYDEEEEQVLYNNLTWGPAPE